MALILDYCRRLSIAYLKSNGYLTLCSSQFGSIVWGDSNAGIFIKVVMHHTTGYARLTYFISGNCLRYCIKIVSRKSNLGKGLIFFFQCPVTGNLCRKLFLINKVFSHYKSDPNTMYLSQTYSKQALVIKKQLDYIACYKKSIDNLPPYFKTHYKGKKTRRMKILKSKIKKARIAYNEA